MRARPTQKIEDSQLPVALAQPENRRHLTETEISLNWQRLPSVQVDRRVLREHHLYSESQPDEDPSAAFDLLRTELLQAAHNHGLTRIAVTSAHRGAGVSHVAANLAIAIARRKSARVVLADLDLARPDLSARFGIRAPGPLVPVLMGEVAPMVQPLRVAGNLALVLNEQRSAAPASVLGEHSAREALDDIERMLQPDIMLVDLPPLPEGDAALSILPAMDGILLVADGTRTTGDDLQRCERALEGKSRLVGLVLNRAEDTTRRWWRRPRRN